MKNLYKKTISEYRKAKGRFVHWSPEELNILKVYFSLQRKKEELNFQSTLNHPKAFDYFILKLMFGSRK